MPDAARALAHAERAAFYEPHSAKRAHFHQQRALRYLGFGRPIQTYVEPHVTKPNTDHLVAAANYHKVNTANVGATLAYDINNNDHAWVNTRQTRSQWRSPRDPRPPPPKPAVEIRTDTSPLVRDSLKKRGLW
jgi:hypothetical protein